MASLLTEIFGYTLPHTFECVTVKPGSLQNNEYMLELVNRTAKLVTIVYIPKDYDLSANNIGGKVLLDSEIALINSITISYKPEYTYNKVRFFN